MHLILYHLKLNIDFFNLLFCLVLWFWVGSFVWFEMLFDQVFKDVFYNFILHTLRLGEMLRSLVLVVSILQSKNDFQHTLKHSSFGFSQICSL